MFGVIDQLRERRWAHLFVAILRILLGFAFLPAGLKKLLGGTFTDPSNTGTFHEFLHAFHATGVFYQFVGMTQVSVAFLLMTQRLSTLGAALALPIFTTILVFCWSTQVYPTASMVTLMWLGNLGLLCWDWRRWRRVFVDDAPALRDRTHVFIDLGLWQWCGAAIFGFYVAIVAFSGGVYRPKGLEWSNPSFWTLPVITLFPLITILLEKRRR